MKLKRTLPLCVAAAALAVPLATSAPALAKQPAKAKAKPTIVLVHGAWADGSSWAPVAQRLQARGYTVDIPPDPLRGLASDSSALAQYLKTVPGPIVLAGHSYGGAVTTDAATGNANVKALVYADAFIPDVNQTVLGLDSAMPGSILGGDPTAVFNFVPAAAPTPTTDVYVKPSIFGAAFGVKGKQAKLLAAEQRPLAFGALNEPSGPPAWKTIPSWAFVGTADRLIPPAEQVAMARHAGAKITEGNAPHLSMLVHPKAVEKVILKAVRATS